MQYIQDSYAHVAQLFVVCCDAEGKRITEYSGMEEELEFILENVKERYFELLIEQLRNNPYEEQIVVDTDYPWVKLIGTAIAVENKPVILWCSYAVLNDVEIPEQDVENWGKIKTTVTREEMSSRMELSRVLVRKLLAEAFLVMNAKEEAKKSKVAETKMKEELRKNQIMTEIVKNLESADEFELVAERIIELAADYLKVNMGNLFKLNKEEEAFQVVCHWAEKEEENKFQDGMKISYAEWALNNERPVFISSGMQLPLFSRQKFNEYGILAIAALPVYVNEEIVMYVNFMETSKERVWELADIQFLGDVAKIIQSIQAKRSAKNSLASSYRALARIMDNVGSGILVTDKATDEVLFANKMVSKHFSEELKKGTLSQNLRKGKKSKYHSGGLEFYAENIKRWFDLHYTELSWVDGREAVLCSIYDVTDKRKYQKKIEQQANNDFLTGLYNRMRCEKDLKKHLLKVKEKGTKGSLFFMDLDNFKNINDGLGHQYGDILLREVSNHLRSIPEISSTCYRMGGDEFIIILPEENYHKKEDVLKALMEVFSKPWYLNGADYYCTMSLGVVDFPMDGQEANDLIKKADIAMYEAKKDGKNRIHYYTEESGSSSLKLFDMEKNMRNSGNEGYRDFIVYYQPIIHIKEDGTTECTGAEALVRWNHATMGFVSPGEFIPLAEYLGLINPIGTYVLKEACKACRNWNELGHPDYKVNVNLSVVQLLQNDIVDIIKKTVVETGINPKNLTLEVTESLAINDMIRMKQVLSEIRKLGIRIALDDFGTGYSALNHIKEIPLDVIKIDQTFVTDVEHDDYAKAFIKMINELAATLDLNVCVEGIERKEQLVVLKKMDVKLMQGFYFDKAIPLRDFEQKYIFNAGGIK
ncbi:MAG: EAL domain-containing protein [Lachnospiraceae bacterium]|nr:EAL domain-containing protein [Lachnospiraceae bacterium]